MYLRRMRTRTIGRVAAILFGIVVAGPSAAEAKEAAVTQARTTVPPQAPQCSPGLSVDELSTYITKRLRVVNVRLERLMLVFRAELTPSEAVWVELQQLLSARETLMQLRENLERTLAHPPPDVPDADDATCTPPPRLVPNTDDPWTVPGT